MKKLLVALSLMLSALTLTEVVSVAPASANSTCNISSPQVNNSSFCAKVTRSWNGSYWTVYFTLQNKGGQGTSSVCYGDVYSPYYPNGGWFNGIVTAFYYASTPGVQSSGPWLGVHSPTRARVRCGSSSWSWSPFPPV